MAPSCWSDVCRTTPIFKDAVQLVREKSAKEALSAATENVEKARGAGDAKTQASALVGCATAAFAVGHLQSALASAGEARKLFRELGMQNEEAAALVMVAQISLDQGRAEYTLALGQDAAEQAKTSKSAKVQVCAQEATTNALLKLSRWEEALQAAVRASVDAEKLKDNGAKAVAITHMAQAYLGKACAKSAVDKAQEAVKLHKGNSSNEAISNLVLSEAYSIGGDAAAAFKASDIAAELFKKDGDRSGEAEALVSRALVHHAKEDREAGLKSAREALLIFRELGASCGLERAKKACALLRKPVAKPVVGTADDQRLPAVSRGSQCVPGVSGPASLASDPMVSAFRVVGAAETRNLAGMVCVVTGAGRGIGKSVAQTLFEAGGIVYVTGRSSPGKLMKSDVPGTVDEIVAPLVKQGRSGVAAHADHTLEDHNRALVKLIETTHGRVDLLVNAVIAVPNCNEDFFDRPAWAQISSDGMTASNAHHVAQTMMFAPCLRRGKGLVVNLASWGMQSFDSSALSAQSCFDRPTAGVVDLLQRHQVYALTLWPGNLKDEKAVQRAQAQGNKLIDMETTKFSGHAIVKLAVMKPDELAMLATTHKAMSCADVVRFEQDGFSHQGNLCTFSNVAQAVY